MEFLVENGTAILAVGSALIAVGAMFATISQARSAKSAVLEARRSADAAETSAAAAERSASADEIMARLSEEEASRYQIPWRIEHVKRQQHLLVNDSDEAALNVRIEGERVHTYGPPEDVGPRSSLAFLYVPMGTDMDVKVRWRRPENKGGEELEWTGHPRG